MRTHELKTWPEPFEAVQRGDKLFEFRRDDRGFAVGDVLVLKKWDPTPHVGYQGCYIDATGQRRAYAADAADAEKLSARVTYILRGFGVPDGYVVMGIAPEKGE